MPTSSRQRLQDLESRFMELEDKLEDTPEKEAISVLHAMLQENVRAGLPGHANKKGKRPSGVTLEAIANLYKQAPAMQGQAENEGLPVGVNAPDFSLPDAKGNQVRLSDYRGKNVVLAFYPLEEMPEVRSVIQRFESGGRFWSSQAWMN